LREQVRLGLATANKIPYLELKIDANQAVLQDITFTETHLEAKIIAKEVELALSVEHMQDKLGIVV